MKQVARKLFIDFEKEEQWINKMAAKGLNFIDYSIGRYLFEEGTPGEYIYRIELLDAPPSHSESKAYIDFLEETGVECVSTFMRWVYLRKKAAEGPFNVYSDYESRIKHYKRITTLIGILGGLNLVIAIINLLIGLYSRTGHSLSYTNLYLSMINFAVVILFTPIFITYLKRMFKMKKEKQLYQ